MYRDSLDKIVESYFAAITAEPFTYKGILYAPKPLRVSPLIRRGYTCPPMCAGCCPTFSLVYLPSEKHPYPLKQRTVEFDGRQVILYEDAQTDNKDWHCRHVQKTDGRCGVHGLHPFHCDFELIRVIRHHDHFQLTQKLFGRGWALKRVDNDRGALCEMTPPDNGTVSDVVRKLTRLETWAKHFGLKTRLEQVIQWVMSGSRTEYLQIPISENSNGGVDVAVRENIQV